MMVSERQARIGRGRVALAAAIMAALIGGGNALAETQSRDVSGFDRITFALPGSLTVSRGETFELSIDADSEDLERIETEVDGSALRIGWDEGMFGLFGGKPEGPIHVRVSLPALQALEVAGSGDVDAGNWLAESFDLEVNGSGSVRFTELATEELDLELNGSGSAFIGKLDAASVKVEISGSGDVELVGAADRQSIEVMGSGDVKATELEGAQVDVEIMGSGDVGVWATDALKAEIMGSGDVRYRGSPKVDEEQHGSGRVRPL